MRAIGIVVAAVDTDANGFLIALDGCFWDDEKISVIKPITNQKIQSGILAFSQLESFGLFCPLLLRIASKVTDGF